MFTYGNHMHTHMHTHTRTHICYKVLTSKHISFTLRNKYAGDIYVTPGSAEKILGAAEVPDDVRLFTTHLYSASPRIIFSR